MDSKTFSRRWFLRATATATVALVAARVLPIEAVPRSGELHEVIHADAIGRLRAAWRAYVVTHDAPPRTIFTGKAIFVAYEGELDANLRIAPGGDSRWSALLFKGVPVREDWGLDPWHITMGPV